MSTMERLAVALVVTTFTACGGTAIPDGKGGSGGGDSVEALGTGGAPGVTATGGRPTASGTAGIPGSGGVAGGSSGDGGSGGDFGDASFVACWDRPIPVSKKTCTTNADCALVNHPRDCCGSVLIAAVNRAEVASINDDQIACYTAHPSFCGCAPQSSTTEDGAVLQFGREVFASAECDNGTCLSKGPPKTFPCGANTCTDQEYCYAFVGGVDAGPGSSSTYTECAPLGGCATCDCVLAGRACDCTMSLPGTVVTCQGA